MQFKANDVPDGGGEGEEGEEKTEKEKQNGEKENNRGGKNRNTKPQGGFDTCLLRWMPHYTNSQTLTPINELHKLQLKPWALI